MDKLAIVIKYADMIILVIIIIVVFFKFKKVLGKRVGYQKSKEENPNIFINTNNELNLDNTGLNTYPEGSLAHSIRAIEIEDSSFEQKKFLESSKKAFMLIINKYYEGNLEDIRPYVGDNIYEGFESHLGNRIGKNLGVVINKVMSAEITHVNKEESRVIIEVKFDFEQFNMETQKHSLHVKSCGFLKDQSNNNEKVWLLVKLGG